MQRERFSPDDAAASEPKRIRNLSARRNIEYGAASTVRRRRLRATLKIERFAAAAAAAAPSSSSSCFFFENSHGESRRRRLRRRRVKNTYSSEANFSSPQKEEAFEIPYYIQLYIYEQRVLYLNNVFYFFIFFRGRSTGRKRVVSFGRFTSRVLDRDARGSLIKNSLQPH